MKNCTKYFVNFPSNTARLLLFRLAECTPDATSHLIGRTSPPWLHPPHREPAGSVLSVGCRGQSRSADRSTDWECPTARCPLLVCLLLLAGQSAVVAAVGFVAVAHVCAGGDEVHTWC